MIMGFMDSQIHTLKDFINSENNTDTVKNVLSLDLVFSVTTPVEI